MNETNKLFIGFTAGILFFGVLLMVSMLSVEVAFALVGSSNSGESIQLIKTENTGKGESIQIDEIESETIRRAIKTDREKIKVKNPSKELYYNDYIVTGETRYKIVIDGGDSSSTFDSDGGFGLISLFYIVVGWLTITLYLVSYATKREEFILNRNYFQISLFCSIIWVGLIISLLIVY